MDNENLNDDVVTLWKTTNVFLGKNKYMLILYYYHPKNKDKNGSFYKCNIRIDTKENWMKIRDGLLSVNPADFFRTSMIGLNDDFRVRYAKRILNKADMYKWIGAKFSNTKVKTFDRFMAEEFLENIKEPYLRKYNVNGNETDISNADSFPEGLWFSTFKEKKKTRKPYGRVIH